MKKMDIKPIRNEDDYQAALHEIEFLFDSHPGTEEGDRLEILATLVESYEEKNFPIPDADPIEIIEYFMETRGLTRSDLRKFIGNSNRISEVLNGKRTLSLTMIRNLHNGLGIPADILIQSVDQDQLKTTRENCYA
jgi:HTH-type transcriptional regulator / antitoxin HigA